MSIDDEREAAKRALERAAHEFVTTSRRWVREKAAEETRRLEGQPESDRDPEKLKVVVGSRLDREMGRIRADPCPFSIQTSVEYNPRRFYQTDEAEFSLYASIPSGLGGPAFVERLRLSLDILESDPEYLLKMRIDYAIEILVHRVYDFARRRWPQTVLLPRQTEDGEG